MLELEVVGEGVIEPVVDAVPGTSNVDAVKLAEGLTESNGDIEATSDEAEGVIDCVGLMDTEIDGAMLLEMKVDGSAEVIIDGETDAVAVSVGMAVAVVELLATVVGDSVGDGVEVAVADTEVLGDKDTDDVGLMEMVGDSETEADEEVDHDGVIVTVTDAENDIEGEADLDDDHDGAVVALTDVENDGEVDGVTVCDGSVVTLALAEELELAVGIGVSETVPLGVMLVVVDGVGVTYFSGSSH